MSWTSSRARPSHPSAPPIRRMARRTSSKERWFVQRTVTPLAISSRAMSFWRSEKPSTRSGSRARILSTRNVVKPPTFAFSRATSGRRAVPGTPTTRSPAPTRWAISAVSAVRQTMRRGKSIEVLPYTRSALVELSPGDRPLESEVLLARHRRPGGLEDLAGAGRAVRQHVDDHRGQRLGRGDVGQRLVDDLVVGAVPGAAGATDIRMEHGHHLREIAHVRGARAVSDLLVMLLADQRDGVLFKVVGHGGVALRSEEHTSELQSLAYLVCRLLLEKKKK